MSYVDPTSGALHRNRHLGGSMWDDVRHELGWNDRADEIAMGWREPDGPALVSHAAGFAVGFVKNMGMGQVRGNFG